MEDRDFSGQDPEEKVSLETQNYLQKNAEVCFWFNKKKLKICNNQVGSTNQKQPLRKAEYLNSYIKRCTCLGAAYRKQSLV